MTKYYFIIDRIGTKNYGKVEIVIGGNSRQEAVQEYKKLYRDYGYGIKVVSDSVYKRDLEFNKEVQKEVIRLEAILLQCKQHEY